MLTKKETNKKIHGAASNRPIHTVRTKVTFVRDEKLVLFYYIIEKITMTER